MDISVVVTTCNEEQTIEELLDSLLVQIKRGSEIIIVDGGSTDKTTAIIENYQRQNRLIRLLKEQGSIAHGRNTGIKNANYSIIALIDAGCAAKKDWLEKITEPFKEKKVELVAGFYEMTGNLPFQKAVAPFLGISPQRFKPNTFLPSARSMAFRKSLWEKIDGFSERLDHTGEDTLFNYKVIEKGIPIVRVKEAIVYWEMPRTLREALVKFYSYAKGDAQAGIWWHPSQRFSTHNVRIALVFARYCLGLAILLFSFSFPQLLYALFGGFAAYLVWSIWKMRDIVTDMEARIWLPIIQVSSDLAIMIGFMRGLLTKL